MIVREEKMNNKKIVLDQVEEPIQDHDDIKVVLTDETIEERKDKLLNKMSQHGLDTLVIYCDVEHSGNFEYLTGFFTRFEEGLLFLHKDNKAVIAVGNENLNKVSKSRIPARAVHIPHFSLPNQPMETNKSFNELMGSCGISRGSRVGIVGWKNFTSKTESNKYLFDVPSYIVNEIQKIVDDSKRVTNETKLLIGEDGVRLTNNLNEIAYYEYGASLASDTILDAMNSVDLGISELELGDKLVRQGQHTNVVTIAATGERYVNGNVFPGNKTIEFGDPVSLTVGYKGGLSSRTGIAVSYAHELSSNQSDYLERVVKPYFNAYVQWLQNVSVGKKGLEIYDLIESVLPKKDYHWSLCPGHLVADEEWLSSPIYSGSQEVLKSGMIFQIDIIPSISGYQGTSAESTVLLLSEEDQERLSKTYPKLYRKMVNRKQYIKNNLGIELNNDLLPMGSTLAYLRPFLLNKKEALKLI